MIKKQKKFRPRIKVDKKPNYKRALAKICIIYINSTQNNTILTGTNIEGLLISTKSQGSVVKKKKGKKSIGYSANLTGELLGSLLREKGYVLCQVRIKGFGAGREQALQGILSSGLRVGEIIDLTKIPHNGCRPRKARRI
jgi:small subunit ribosomal protein S11